MPQLGCGGDGPDSSDCIFILGHFYGDPSRQSQYSEFSLNKPNELSLIERTFWESEEHNPSSIFGLPHVSSKAFLLKIPRSSVRLKTMMSFYDVGV